MRPSPSDPCPCGSGKKPEHCCQARGGPETRAFIEDALVRLERLMGQGGPLVGIRFEPELFPRVISGRLEQLEQGALEGEELLVRLLESSMADLWTERFTEQARARLQATLQDELPAADHAAVALALSTLERVAARQGSDPLLCPLCPIAFRLQLREWLDAESRLAEQLERTACELAKAADRADGENASGPRAPRE